MLPFFYEIERKTCKKEKMMSKTKISTLILGVLLLFGVGQAEQPLQEAAAAEENVMVDSRPLSVPAELYMQQAREAELQQAYELSDDQALQLGVLIIPIKSQNLIALASNELHTTAAPLASCHYHSISSFPEGNVIKINNGSEWLFDKGDAHILRNWNSGQKIVITPNQELLSTSHFTYIMNNLDVGDSVKVKLFLGPSAFGPSTTWIVGIDQNLGKVYMINGKGERTIWEVSSSDMYLVKDWKVNDTVILGENDSWLWFFSSYNSIMVNVNMNHFVRAKHIFQANQKLVG